MQKCCRSPNPSLVPFLLPEHRKRVWQDGQTYVWECDALCWQHGASEDNTCVGVNECALFMLQNCQCEIL